MLKPGDTFERYTVNAVLGQGGMGTVYRAHDARLDRRVAIKVITDEACPEEARARLLREARSVAALDHPNAVSIFDVGELSGSPYIVMELVTGRTLREAIADASTPVSVRVGWLADVARALLTAHKKGLVHRDIKPENVMVRDDGVVKVLDFGIARRAQGNVDPSAPTQKTALPTLTKEGVKVGTPLYMAPEQIRSEPLDGRADQFAWGVLAYELFTGKVPWKNPRDPLAVVASILTDAPDGAALDAAGVPAEAKVAVLRALSKKADNRFASMDDLVRALDPTVKGEAPSERARVSVRPPNAAPASPAGATQLQRYSTEEVRRILSRAVEQQEDERVDARLGFDDLVAAAREVGVDEATLREATREMRARGEVPPQRDDFEAWRRRKRRKFLRHLGVWAVVSCVMILFALVIGERDALIGMVQVPLWWGIGIGIHGLSALMADEDGWREEMEKEARKARKQRRRREVVDGLVEQGASLLTSTGAAIQQRVQAMPEPAPRARIATDTRAAAEQEAAAEAEAVTREAQRRR